MTVLLVCQELHEQGHATTAGLAVYLVQRWRGTFLSVLAIKTHQNNFRGVFFSWKHLQALCYEHLRRFFQPSLIHQVMLFVSAAALVEQ